MDQKVVFWKDLLDSGSYGEARAKGKVRTEGKDYIVKNGDVKLILNVVFN